MKIELYYFTTPEESARLPEGWNNNHCTRKECKAVARAAYAYRTLGKSIFFYEYDFQAYRQENPEAQRLFDYFKIKAAPALVLYDPDTKLAVAALKGADITEANILKLLYKLDEYVSAGNVNGVFGYYKQDGEFVPLPDVLEDVREEGFGSPIGFGLLDLSNLFGFKIPWWAWIVPAGFLAFKAFDTENKNKRLVYGVGSAFFGLQIYLATKK